MENQPSINISHLTAEEISVDYNFTVIETLRRMDSLSIKLLIVTKNERYHSLISIGDLQRSLIDGKSLEEKIRNCLRNKVRTATTSDSAKTIRQIMLINRTEFMPVLDQNGQLDRVIFWSDLYAEKPVSNSNNKVNVPVVIMAGGKGSRLEPLTSIIPKPLIPIGDKPIIEMIIDRFSDANAAKYFCIVNYKKELIMRHFESIPDGQYDIEFIIEAEPLGTAGSLSQLQGKITGTFFLTNCDIIVENDLHEILQYHRDNKNEITVVTAIRSVNIPYGTVESNAEGLLTLFKEKPEFNVFVNTGMYVLEPDVLNEIPTETSMHMTDIIDQIMERSGRVGVFPVSEKSWMDIGEWPEYQRTAALLTNKAA